MATVEVAQWIKRIGRTLTMFGALAGLILWLVALPGQLSFGGQFIFTLPLVVGSVAWLLGVILEGFAEQSDVGRQTRQS